MRLTRQEKELVQLFFAVLAKEYFILDHRDLQPSRSVFRKCGLWLFQLIENVCKQFCVHLGGETGSKADLENHCCKGSFHFICSIYALC